MHALLSGFAAHEREVIRERSFSLFYCEIHEAAGDTLVIESIDVVARARGREQIGCVANRICTEVLPELLPVSCGDTEEGVDEFTLSDRVTLRQPPDLTLPNHMHRLVTFNRSPGCLHRPEAQARRDSLLDEAMVLLDNVIQVRRCAALTVPAQCAGLLQFVDGAGVGRCPSTLITRGRLWWPTVNARRRKICAAVRSRWADNMKSMVSPVESTARYR